MPGSGKSTVSRLVAEGLERSARIRGDDLAMMVVSGAVWFDSPDRVHSNTTQHQSPEATAAAILDAAPVLPALSGGTA